MVSFGIMTLNLKNENQYFTEIAKRAFAHGIDCYRFVPSKINPVTQKITGEKFDKNRMDWVSHEFPMPEILYDRCFYGDDAHSKQCISIVNWLKTRDDIKFLGYGLPNKWELYQWLSNTEMGAYLPQTKLVNQPEDVFHFLNRINPIILKPVNGSQGYGIFYMERKNQEYLVRTDKQDKQVSHLFQSEEKASKWLNSLLRQRKYLMQPYLSLTNKNKQPFDIRTLLQKNQSGHWKKVGSGIRTGARDGILSNLSAGASVTSYDTWIDRLPSALESYVKDELKYIFSHLPSILENKFLPLFELGIDIGVDKEGALWILDINSKPGRKVVLRTEPSLKDDLYHAPLLYALELSKLDSVERRTTYAQTLSD